MVTTYSNGLNFVTFSLRLQHCHQRFKDLKMPRVELNIRLLQSRYDQVMKIDFDRDKKYSKNLITGHSNSTKYQQSGVPTRDSSSRRILKVGDLSRVEDE